MDVGGASLDGFDQYGVDISRDGRVGAAGENYGIYATYTNAVVGGNVSAIATNGTGIFANSWVERAS